jgi:MFS family permease
VVVIPADNLHTSVARMNLTFTAFLAISDVASIAGDAADMFGRIPVYMAMLILYLCANIGLVMQNSFITLLSCRVLQSAGISGGFTNRSYYNVLIYCVGTFSIALRV